MNREEKHELVIKLFKEGKTMREIAKEVHMSFGDIGSITRKENEDKEPKIMEKSQESQALKLFRRGKNPVDVAITLDLSPSKAEGIYKEYWKLRGLYSLLHLFEQVKGDISLLLKVHDLVKKYSITKKDIIHIIKYADQYTFLKKDVEDLESELSNLIKQRQDMNKDLLSMRKEQTELEGQIDHYNDISIQKYSYIENLNDEIKKLESHISKLKNSDESYTMFEQFAREKMDTIMENRRWILSLAIAVVIESLTSNQDKKQIMITDPTESNETFESAVLELSQKLFEKILSELVDVSLQVTAAPIIQSDEYILEN